MELRDRVLLAAKSSFAQFGYKGTTMEQVARIAGVGKGTIYTFFESKESLFQHILTDLIKSMRDVAEQSIIAGDPFFSNLERAMRKLVQFRKEHEVFVKLVQEVRQFGTSQVNDGLAQVEQAIVGYLRHHLDEGVKQGDVHACDTELVAFILLRTYTALVTDWEINHHPLSDDALMQMFHSVFASGLNRTLI